MRVHPFVIGTLLVLTGCSAAPTQPAPDAFNTKFLNLASIASQVGNMTNIGVNNQINVSPVVTPVTAVQAMSSGSQYAGASPTISTDQGLGNDFGQYLGQGNGAL